VANSTNPLLIHTDHDPDVKYDSGSRNYHPENEDVTYEAYVIVISHRKFDSRCHCSKN